MKNGKNPSRAQKEKLKSVGLNPESWFVTKNCPTCFEVVHRITGEVRKLGA